MDGIRTHELTALTLKRCRLWLALSQRELAQVTGYRQETIARWEDGRQSIGDDAQLKLRWILLRCIRSEKEYRKKLKEDEKRGRQPVLTARCPRCRGLGRLIIHDLNWGKI